MKLDWQAALLVLSLDTLDTLALPAAGHLSCRIADTGTDRTDQPVEVKFISRVFSAVAKMC